MQDPQTSLIHDLLFRAMIHIVHCAENAMQGTHMGQLSENIGSFRSEYGRLCVLIAQALADGHDKDTVVEAAQGLSLPSALILVQIRQQRDRANRAYYEAKRVDCPRNVIVDVAREARRVVSGEFMTELPLLKGATA